MNTHQFFYDQVAKNIAAYEQNLVGVGSEEGNLPFTYTIGNHEVGLPELLIIGGAAGLYGHVLNTLGAMMRERGAPFSDGELVSLGGEHPVRIINVPTSAVSEDYTCQVEHYYQTTDYKVQQVVVCDTSGRFPDEEGCDEPWSLAPVLERVPH